MYRSCALYFSDRKWLEKVFLGAQSLRVQFFKMWRTAPRWQQLSAGDNSFICFAQIWVKEEAKKGRGWPLLRSTSVVLFHPRPSSQDGAACLSGCLPSPVYLLSHDPHRHIQKQVFPESPSPVKLSLRGSVHRFPQYGPGIFHKEEALLSRQGIWELHTLTYAIQINW